MTDKDLKIYVGSAVVGICFVLGLFFTSFYQPEEKNIKLYSSALKDYANNEFQNAYYLFSKVGFFSDLKPYAIYHQAECAKKLNDKASELKQYKLLYTIYKKNELGIRSRYLASQLLINEKPELAKKNLKKIITLAPNSDYAIASEYFLGIIDLNRYEKASFFPNSAKNEIEMSLRHYLKKAPQGRHALNAVDNWLLLDKEISSDDYLLMAKTVYLFGNNEKAQELLEKTDKSNSWFLRAKNLYALKKYAEVKSIIIDGLKNYTKFVSEKDIYDAVDLYLILSKSKKNDIDYLFSISDPKGKDYIWLLKCDNTISKFQAGCYQQLYSNFQGSVFGAKALANLFIEQIKSKKYDDAEKIGMDYLGKVKNGADSPMILFWLGKINERNNKNQEATNFYKRVLINYPDNFYAYRAYIAMKHIDATVLNADIIMKPVEYPYKNIEKNSSIKKLVLLRDYDILDIIVEDEFIKSWIYYQKGDYSHSMLVARDAMEKIFPRPDREDLRWRLVYPIDYYEEIERYSGTNDKTLIMALIREESYFNPNAISYVGARGLMQLMPATAKEINSQYAYGMNDLDDLFKPEFNIKLGNTYYAQLRSALNNLDISAIAAYNGGIGSVEKWKKNISYSDTDEFIEHIPYSETKNYVKKVFRSYWNYLRLYVK